MSIGSQLASGPAVADWEAWSCRIRLVVTDPGVLDGAAAITRAEMEAVELACSRFRPDSDLSRVAASGGATVPIGPLAAVLVGVALDAAARTGGRLDPTVGADLVRLGYDRDIALLPPDGAAARVVLTRRPGWSDVVLDSAAGTLRLPQGVQLDLGATAKAWAADTIASRIAAETGSGVLVSLGGDIAVAGAAPAQGWAVRVQDRPGSPDDSADGPSQVIAISGGGVATSSTSSRSWTRGGIAMHHIVDPRTGHPADSPWRTVSVAAGSCLQANVASTAALAGGDAAPWLREQGLPARLVSRTGEIVTLGGWPAEEPA
jgi:thiamine biosynthesis lipoprotein